MAISDELILKRFARRTREFRKKRRLTQQELAELADLDYKYIQKIESKKPPSIGLLKLVRLSQGLRISVSRFLDFL